MRVLLAHCLDWRLGRHLSGHSVRHVGKIGWGALKNGELLARAAREFDVFVTSDKNLPHQQNLIQYEPAVVVLDVRTNTLEDCLLKIPALLAALPRAKKGEALWI